MDIKPNLIGITAPELAQSLADMGVPAAQVKMRRRQIWSWLYAHGVEDIEAMHTINKDLRATLADHYRLEPLKVAEEQMSDDGTIKWLFQLDDGFRVETVYIPEPSRGTLCISAQVGCTLNCRFCHTGTQKLVRNLTTAEIVAQVVTARHILKDWSRHNIEGASAGANINRHISNVVCMGMGEPLYNAENMAKGLNIISDGDGLALSRRRITLSTAGVVPEIKPMGEKTGVMLAISLHAVNDDLRNELVPINKKYPLAELLAACKQWPNLSNAKRITFEYVMLDGINDSDAEARQLVRLLASIPAKINLIPFNPWAGSPYECAPPERVKAFADIVNKAGYASPVRRPRGRDIMAACGQLRTADVKKSAAEKRREATPAPAPAPARA